MFEMAEGGVRASRREMTMGFVGGENGNARKAEKSGGRRGDN